MYNKKSKTNTYIYSTHTNAYIYGQHPGKHTKNYGKPPFLIGKSTISMAVFHIDVNVGEFHCWLVSVSIG